MKKEDILNSLEKDIENISTQKEIIDLKAKYLGKKGMVTELTKNMRDLSDEKRREVGKISNEVKKLVTEKLIEIENKLQAMELTKKLETEKIDVTLPGIELPFGTSNILEKLIEDLENLFMGMGYDVEEGPEVEKDLYNFELLNLPKGHPARDAQDTFYTKDDILLLRSQTSPVQVRTMLKTTEKEPIRIICPGKVYRRDDDDATHSHQFTQIEGLLIDKNISLADLKGTFDVVAKHLFGSDRETRFRPSFYPFTEPSVELDISCFNCGGKGCHICKGTGWITVGGAGLVHPKVLENGGYDSNIWGGFAFGFGAERLAMLKYGITDVRTFYTTDLRNTNTFDRRESE
ncbi:MAG: phenylalanine--tRNA ligase subunit alpha [Bacilli bacterium]|nr:phenylalanine--tRNA ligase subunit alpha [Bacilli bacterium]